MKCLTYKDGTPAKVGDQVQLPWHRQGTLQKIRDDGRLEVSYGEVIRSTVNADLIGAEWVDVEPNELLKAAVKEFISPIVAMATANLSIFEGSVGGMSSVVWPGGLDQQLSTAQETQADDDAEIAEWVGQHYGHNFASMSEETKAEWRERYKESHTGDDGIAEWVHKRHVVSLDEMNEVDRDNWRKEYANREPGSAGPMEDCPEHSDRDIALATLVAVKDILALLRKMDSNGMPPTRIRT